MLKYLILLSLVAPVGAWAEIPQIVHCRNEDGSGNMIFHSFELNPIATEKYRVRIHVLRAPVTAENPNDEMSSEDSTLGHVNLFDATYTGRKDKEDKFLIYFDQGGFIQIESNQTDAAVLLQLPGDGAEMAQVIDHCVFPEPRAGVGN